MKIKHTLKPIYNKNTKVLILGSIPSIVSRELDFYYANKSNRFWKVINILFNVELKTKDEKINFLLRNNIGLFDVIKECDINNSSDNSIKNIIVNDIDEIINKTKIKTVFCIGKKAFNTYIKYFNNQDINIIYLPSTSSANASYTLDLLVKEYSIIKTILNN